MTEKEFYDVYSRAVAGSATARAYLLSRMSLIDWEKRKNRGTNFPRLARVLRLRLAGALFKTVGQAIGTSGKNAHKLVEQALRKLHRDLERETFPFRAPDNVVRYCAGLDPGWLNVAADRLFERGYGNDYEHLLIRREAAR